MQLIYIGETNENFNKDEEYHCTYLEIQEGQKAIMKVQNKDHKNGIEQRLIRYAVLFVLLTGAALFVASCFEFLRLPLFQYYHHHFRLILW